MRPVLITAGATRNPIDQMRCITANASGKTGVTLAECLDGKCLLLGSPVACLRAADICRTELFSSTRDLMEKMKKWVEENPSGIIVHSAAVGDYECVNTSKKKIASGMRELSIELRPTPKILDQISRWSEHVSIVSFKAAGLGTSPEELLDIAKAQKERSDSTVVFGNVLGSTEYDVLLLIEDDIRWYPQRAAAVDALGDWISQQIHGP
jgi:phosphopantothenoylcysteine decarboxylase / phosphopantothenate---cysteine ligase